MSSVRLRRLQADFEKLSDFVRRHPRLRLVQAEGQPPERYQLEYRIKSLRQADEELVPVKSHMVEISLPRNYPRTPPQCRMLTPIFHPNIAPHAICIGDHWAAGEPLWAMVARIGEMIAYQSYNTQSPLNGEAARWVDKNLDRLPLDGVSMTIDEPDSAAVSPSAVPAPPVAAAVPARPAAPAPSFKLAPPPPPVKPAPLDQLPRAVPIVEPAPPLQVQCPGCKTRYRVSAELGARRVRCKRCQTVIEIPARSPGLNSP